MKNNSYKTMTRALIRAALVIALVTAAVFLLIRLVPGDPVVMVLGEHATDYMQIRAIQLNMAYRAAV